MFLLDERLARKLCEIFCNNDDLFGHSDELFLGVCSGHADYQIAVNIASIENLF